MTPEDRKRLRELASTALALRNGKDSWWDEWGLLKLRDADRCIDHEEAAVMAAASPTVVIALLDRIDEFEARQPTPLAPSKGEFYGRHARHSELLLIEVLSNPEATGQVTVWRQSFGELDGVRQTVPPVYFDSLALVKLSDPEMVARKIAIEEARKRGRQ